MPGTPAQFPTDLPVGVIPPGSRGEESNAPDGVTPVAVRMEPARPRLTVRAMTYYQAEGTQPRLQDPKYTRFVDDPGGDGPYSRPAMKITDRWEPVDHGWVTDGSLLIIENMEAVTGGPVHPSEEEMAARRRRVILMGVDTGRGVIQNGVRIPPGEFAHFPYDPAVRLFLKTVEGESVKASVTSYPV